MPTAAIYCLLLLIGGLFSSPVSAATSLFDPTRDMHVSEVRPGMLGYGLSVFSGHRIDRFDVEVVDIVRNFNPHYDVVLIRCKGDFLQHTGPIAGMSGSPIYLYDNTGKARLIGAFAYGWVLAKDPLAGVQPIEYMLKLPDNPMTPFPSGAASAEPVNPGASPTGSGPRWSIDDVRLPQHGFGMAGSAGRQSAFSSMRSATDIAGAGLQPLETPLMAAGFSQRMLANISPLFDGSGIVPMQAGSATAASTDGPQPQLEPGSVLGIPLLTGDMELTAIGTCTERIGNRVFGFGHPFGTPLVGEGSSGGGEVSLPVCAGTIATVVANLQMSFKLGAVSPPEGAITADQVVGVAGMVGPSPPMIPMTVHVIYDDGTFEQTFHFHAALHPKMTPTLAAVAVVSALTSYQDLPPFHTIDYDLKLNFANGQHLDVANTSVANDAGDIIQDLQLALSAATDNPFQQVLLSDMEATIHVAPVTRLGQILSVMVPRSKYAPGETIRAYISYQPFRATEADLPVDLTLPRNLPDGTYQLTVSDFEHYLDDEKSANPFKFTAESIDELFTAVRDVTSIKHNALYLRLIRQPDGIAVGRTALPRMPSNRREEFLNAGRSDVTQFVSSTVRVVPTNLVMQGNAAFEITIEKHARVEAASNPSAAGDSSGEASGASAQTNNNAPATKD
jgi:hypothetical protein